MRAVHDIWSRATWMALAAMSGCGQAQNAPETQMKANSVAVYALSRGKGVPETTRAAHEKAREFLEQLRAEKRVLDIKETPMGLEGERRICATFASEEDAAQAATRLREIGAGVELFNVVLESCATPGAPPPQGAKP